jgi:hypothetical protein
MRLWRIGELEKWGWHESDYDRGWECDFERMRLSAAFQGLGLNAKPRYDDDGEPANGDNDCFSITHYDKENYADPQAEWPQMMPLLKQKYFVDGKEYTVGTLQVAEERVARYSSGFPISKSSVVIGLRFDWACRLPVDSSSSPSTSRVEVYYLAYLSSHLLIYASNHRKEPRISIRGRY